MPALRDQEKYEPDPHDELRRAIIGSWAPERHLRLRKYVDITRKLMPLIHEHQGVSFGYLYAATCNTTPADGQRYKEALGRLIDHGEVVVMSPKGEGRRKASTIGDEDMIRRSQQRSFWLPN